MAAVNTELAKEIDRIDQYARRSNIILKNIVLPDKETSDQLETKIKKIIEKDLELKSAVVDIDKLHRIGKVKKSAKGKKTQNVIVRFKSHSTRYSVYYARKKLKSIKISPNLNHKRGKLWFDASKIVENVEGIDFVYPDAHGDLKFRTSSEHDGEQNFKFESLDNLEAVFTSLGLKLTDE